MWRVVTLWENNFSELLRIGLHNARKNGDHSEYGRKLFSERKINRLSENSKKIQKRVKIYFKDYCTVYTVHCSVHTITQGNNVLTKTKMNKIYQGVHFAEKELMEVRVEQWPRS